MSHKGTLHLARRLLLAVVRVIKGHATFETTTLASLPPPFRYSSSMSGACAQIVASAKVLGDCSVGVLCGTSLAPLFLSSPHFIFFQGSKRLPLLHRKMVLDRLAENA